MLALIVMQRKGVSPTNVTEREVGGMGWLKNGNFSVTPGKQFDQ